MTFLSNTADTIARFLGYVRATPEQAVRYDVRGGVYTINELLYRGSVYQTRQNGGAAEDVLRTYIGDAYCNPTKYPIHPYCMPFAEIVNAYQYVLPGTWGDGVTIADEVDGRPVDPRILDPLAMLWRASNLDSEKAKIIRWAANFGTVGIRITGRAATNGRPPRVAIGADHPERLFNFEEDAEGNVVAVALKYTTPLNRGSLADPVWEDVEVVETLDKDEFSRKQDGVETLPDDQRENGLGFCPYVVLRHKDNGTPYGDWAYRGIEAAVHRLNFRISRQDKSIDRHQFPKWFAAAGGAAPTTDLDMGDEALTYVQTTEGTPPPILQAIVPQVDQASSQAFWQELREMLRGRQPELNLNDVKLLGNSSGEALAQVLKPTEKVIGDARPGYDHAFVRALQMGLSAGVYHGAWDLGTGSGPDAADRAFRDGIESFAFGPRPLLPPTVFQITQQVAANFAEDNARLDLAAKAKGLGLGEREVLRTAGYDDERIDALIDERSKQPVLPFEDDVGGIAEDAA